MADYDKWQVLYAEEGQEPEEVQGLPPEGFLEVGPWEPFSTHVDPNFGEAHWIERSRTVTGWKRPLRKSRSRA